MLKVLNAVGRDDEKHAAALLHWYNAHGAVELINANADALLLEYAPGGELAELVYAGHDEEASTIICSVVQKLHEHRRHAPPAELIPLRSRFRDLYQAASTSKNPLIREAAAIADSLLNTTEAEVPLHGDLHHHNIMKSNRGWLAIDPKGLFGDPAYEVSNLFANPLQSAPLCEQLARTRRLLHTTSDVLGYPYERIVRFAFVHNVLSTVWSGTADNPEASGLIVAGNLRRCFSTPPTPGC